ncbi:endospore germination permease [Brevibacillus borstelensis]|uniref:GerAB/ArcD/ProY family transporter n=1 Tax=Brevibacillus borstelensis TaxID=45462 RepID=UPI0030BC79E8
MKNGISFVQLVFILMLSNGLMNHVIVIPLLLDAARRDAWLSVLGVVPLYLLFIWMIACIYRNTGNGPLLEWLKKQYGTGTAKVLSFLFAIYVFALAVITIKDTVTWVNLTFAPRTPMYIHGLVFALVCLINSLFGIRSIAMVSVLLLPIVVVLGFFVMSTNLQYKDYSYLFPILEYGWEPMKRGMVYAGAGFSELILLLLLKQHIGVKVTFWRLAVLGAIMVWLTLGPLTGAITEFGPEEAAKLRYPAFEEWRLVKIGLYIEHVDFFSIYQWFSGAFIRVSLAFYLLVEIFDFPDGRKRVRVLVLACIVAVCMALWPYDDISFYLSLTRFLLPGLLIAALLLSLTLALLALLSRKKEDLHEK